MAKFSFSEIENAFMYVASAMYGMNSAVVCKAYGEDPVPFGYGRDRRNRGRG